jgi:hypothetical protein
MMTWILLGGLAAIVALLGLAGYALYRAGREDGYEQGYADAREEKLTEDRQARAQKAGRHRMSQPRADLPLQPAAVTPEPKTSLVRSGYRDSWHLPAVFWTAKDGPDKRGAADTGTLAKVTSTGEMAVLTDSFIADLEMREAAYRKEHAESEA